jgi:hypothetical protein
MLLLRSRYMMRYLLNFKNPTNHYTSYNIIFHILKMTKQNSMLRATIFLFPPQSFFLAHSLASRLGVAHTTLFVLMTFFSSFHYFGPCLDVRKFYLFNVSHTVTHFVCLWQIVSYHGLTRLKIFVSRSTSKRCN